MLLREFSNLPRQQFTPIDFELNKIVNVLYSSINKIIVQYTVCCRFISFMVNFSPIIFTPRAELQTAEKIHSRVRKIPGLEYYTFLEFIWEGGGSKFV
jgi:hypothetical protein